MKKTIAIIIFVVLGIFSFQAQKNVQMYFGISESTGMAIGGTTIEESDLTGYRSGNNEFSLFGLTRSKLPISVGLQAEAGIVIKEKLMIGTGIKYLFRQEEAIYYCHVCDLFISEPSNLNAYFLEIPLRIQLNLIEDKSFFPTVSSEIYWSKSNFQEDYIEDLSFWGYKLGVGVARKINRHQFNLEWQFNRTSANQLEYPTYSLRELLLNLRWTMNLF